MPLKLIVSLPSDTVMLGCICGCSLLPDFVLHTTEIQLKK